MSERLERLRKQFEGKLSQSFIGTRGSASPLPTAMMEMGAKLRETYAQYPVLPGAVHTYQDLASTREWTVSGTVRAATRALDWLNDAQTVNPKTGMVDYGFDQFLRRRVIDYLTVGATTFICENDPDSPLQYADPTKMKFIRQNTTTASGHVKPVRPTEVIWQYAGQQTYRHNEVWIHYSIPVGADGFLSPLMQVLPTAVLAWLIRESDTASVDGRRIRDILLINNPQVQDAVEEALLMQLALWNGSNPEDIGIPIVTINGAQQPVKDMFARLGLSEIPTTFSREEFIFEYVNEISSAIGLALRHFWNNERTTNRALEVVQEQRQQQKGPAAFVRNEQRLINRSGLLSRFGGSKKVPVRFSFLEETDASSMRERAEVLKLTAEAFGKIFENLGAAITVDSYIAWMQSTGTLPYEIELADVKFTPDGIVLQSDPGNEGNPDMQRVSSDPIASPFAAQSDNDESSSEVGGVAGSSSGAYNPADNFRKAEQELAYGEVVIKNDGTILAKRNQIFSLNRMLSDAMRPDIDARDALRKMDDRTFMRRAAVEEDATSADQFLELLQDADFPYDSYKSNPQFDTLLDKVLNGRVNDITETERKLLYRITLGEV